MKKKILLIAVIAAGIFCTSNVNAQDYKPAGGEKNVEVNFSPLGSNPISINSLRFRYFKSSDMAIRVGLNLSVQNSKSPRVDSIPLANPPAGVPNPTPNGVETEDESKTFGFGLAVGIEKHFPGTDRLSPYMGAELTFSTVSVTETDVLFDASTNTDPITGLPTQALWEDTYESETTSGSTSFGVNLVLGADWYFAKNFYMGTEVGLGFVSTSQKDEEVTNPSSAGFAGAANNGDGNGNPTSTTLGGSSMNIGTNFNSAIRLGFLF